tara:strand:+ start:2472 stop:3560 length:1089 start_codon:yes stop_codon:yes gene_type:complete
MSVPTKYVINDVRSFEQFKVKSYSGFLTKDVVATFKKNILKNNIEESCNWCIELFLSLHIEKLYSILLEIALKNINILSPKLPGLLLKRFKQLIDSNLSQSEMRNSQMVRNHIIDLCIIVCMSNKNKTIGITTLKEHEMDATFILKKIKSEKSYVDSIFRSNDPDEIKFIVNEMVHNMKTSDFSGTIYMLSWLIQYDKLSNKKKKPITCHERTCSTIKKENQTDLIWLLWEIVISESQKTLSQNSQREIDNLFKLYKLFYKPKSKYKYINLYLFALKYFTDIYDIHTPLIYNYYISLQICMKINYMIGQKKHLEVVKSTNVSFDIIKKKKENEKNKKKNPKQIKAEAVQNRFNILCGLDINN